jgi:hypothetical protein
MSDVVQMMRAANPVPDSDAALTSDDFDALLLLTQSRSGNVDVQELTKPVEPEKKRYNGWLVAAAAFAVVIVFIGAAMLLASPADELPPATTPPTTQAVTPTTQAAPPTTVAAIEEPTPTTVAPVVDAEPVMTDEIIALLESYESAFNAGDAEAFRALFAVDARRADSRDPGNTVSVDKMVDEMLWLGVRASSLDLDIGNCVAISDGARCEAAYSGPVEAAMYAEGVLERTYRLQIADGAITGIGETCPASDCRVQMNLAYWAKENHGVRLVDWWPVLAGTDAELWLEYAVLWGEAGRPRAP